MNDVWTKYEQSMNNVWTKYETKYASGYVHAMPVDRRQVPVRRHNAGHLVDPIMEFVWKPMDRHMTTHDFPCKPVDSDMGHAMPTYIGLNHAIQYPSRDPVRAA